jgi:hypothetical protein
MILPPWVYPAAGATLLVIGFAGGWQVQGWRCDAAKAEALERAQRRFNKQLDAIHTAATEYERNRERGQAETRERETKVREIYRDVQVPAECEPGPDALRLLDDALDAAAKASGQPGAVVPVATE